MHVDEHPSQLNQKYLSKIKYFLSIFALVIIIGLIVKIIDEHIKNKNCNEKNQKLIDELKQMNSKLNKIVLYSRRFIF